MLEVFDALKSVRSFFLRSNGRISATIKQIVVKHNDGEHSEVLLLPDVGLNSFESEYPGSRTANCQPRAAFKAHATKFITMTHEPFDEGRRRFRSRTFSRRVVPVVVGASGDDGIVLQIVEDRK